jgi:hypothetical protein
VAPPELPVSVTGVEVETVAVVTVKVALVAPGATVTEPGTLATAALALDSVTTAPDAGAALVSVAVPCEAAPPVTLPGLSAIVDNAGPGGGVPAALTVSDVAALRRRSPVIVTAVSEATDVVAIGNVALAAPAGTVTLAGTLAALPALNNCTDAPPGGAALCSATVPVDAAPPLTLAGDRVTLISGGVAAAGGLTVRPRLVALAPYDADSETALVADTALLVTNANDALVDPVKTVTVPGSDAKSSG